ncbi:hypothetical protein ACFL0Q_02305 [Thermodesulfobacteriota bacterium]
MIQRTTGLPDKELLSHLSLLKDSELLYERGVYPQSSYVFRHALTRDVVYESILAKTKKRLHGVVAHAVEEMFRDHPDEQFGVLADHYIASENYEKGANYSKLAERKAEKTGAINDAIPFSEKRITSLERLPMTDDTQRKIIDTRTNLGLYYVQLPNPVKAKETIDPIRDTAQKLGYKRRLSQIGSIMGLYHYWVEGDPEKAIEQWEGALRIAEEENDVVSELFARAWLGMYRIDGCEFERALRHLERGMEINKEANSLWGISIVKANKSRIYRRQGKLD